MLRPVCFYSAYEAATSFVIGQRIAMRQSARIKERLRESAATGRPSREGYPRFRARSAAGDRRDPRVSAPKVKRLHGIAQAALDGRLDTEALRAIPTDEALAHSARCPASAR